MESPNPYQAPKTLHADRGTFVLRLIARRLCGAAALALAGFCAYFAGVLFFSMLDPAIRLSDARWYWGLVLSLAFASSQCFRIPTYSLKTSPVRRLMVSSSVTLCSFLVTQAVAVKLGWEKSGYDDPVVLPRLIVGIPTFLCIAFATRRALLALAICRSS